MKKANNSPDIVFQVLFCVDTLFYIYVYHMMLFRHSFSSQYHAFNVKISLTKSKRFYNLSSCFQIDNFKWKEVK